MKPKLVKDGPITARRYPWPRGVNPDVEPASWPFSGTVKRPGDVVITNIAPIPTRSAETRSRLRSWVAGIGSKKDRP